MSSVSESDSAAASESAANDEENDQKEESEQEELDDQEPSETGSKVQIYAREDTERLKIDRGQSHD